MCGVGVSRSAFHRRTDAIRLAEATHHGTHFGLFAQETGLPVRFHIGGGEDNVFEDLTTQRRPSLGWAGAEAYAAMNLFIKNGFNVPIQSRQAFSGASLICVLYQSRAASSVNRLFSRSPTTAISIPTLASTAFRGTFSRRSYSVVRSTPSSGSRGSRRTGGAASRQLDVTNFSPLDSWSIIPSKV
jgi:hypothetical protein